MSLLERIKNYSERKRYLEESSKWISRAKFYDQDSPEFRACMENSAECLKKANEIFAKNTSTNIGK